jgi:hypothetical protein
MDRDLIEDIRRNENIMSKVRDGKQYAQNLYAALCNIRWQPIEVFPILNDEYWTCSWRAAGGIVASLRSVDEDYMDWYCSGSGGFSIDDDMPSGYVGEGIVTDEIESDMKSIGWQYSEYPDD